MYENFQHPLTSLKRKRRNAHSFARASGWSAGCNYAILTLLLLSLTTTALAQSSDAKFLAGLRERQLYELAEKFCTERLAAGQISPREQSELTVELIRTYAMHAANVPDQDRAALWQAARQSAAEFSRQSPQHPRAILVQMQDALTLLAQGELGRQEYEAGALGSAELEPTRVALRESAVMLEKLAAHLIQEVPLRRRVETRGDELSADELFSLQQHVEHQLARSYRNQALLYEPQSQDRTALLLKAVETINRALPQTPAEEPLAAQLQLDLATCQRLLGNHEQAGSLLTALDRDEVEPTMRLRARAELLRLHSATRSLPAAEAILRGGRTIGGQASAEFDLATFETYLALWQAASLAQDEAAAKAWQQKAAEMAKFLEVAHGSYWGRRADQMLVHRLPRGTGGMNVDLLSRTADQLYLKNEFDQAIAAYDKAAEQARAGGNASAAFDLRYKAALVQQKRLDHAQAAERFRALSLEAKSHPQASEAHLLAAWNAAQATRRNPSAATQYAALLAEQIEHWPTTEAASQARMWLGMLHTAQQAWGAAVAAYRGVPRESQHFPAAVAALAACWRKSLAAEQAAGADIAPAAEDAVKYFQQAILGPENRLPERWSDTERLAALTSAEILLDFLPGREADAEGILTTALEASPGAPEAWKSAVQARLVVCLASQPSRQAEAQRLVQGIGAASPQKLVEMLASLSSVAERSRPEIRQGIAALQLQAVALLAPQREQLEKNAVLLLDQLHAEALAAAGKRAEALAAFDKLTKANPTSGPLQEGYAALLLAGKDSTSLQQALDRWRIIAARSKPRTERWYRAKHSVALAQLRLGDKQSAATLVRYMLETPPGLDGSAWKQPFVNLLKQCEP